MCKSVVSCTLCWSVDSFLLFNGPPRGSTRSTQQGEITMQHVSRRQFLQAAGAGAAALAFATRATTADADKKPGFTLPKLPYDYNALEPHIDVETMKIHHDKHHQAYVDNLNKALAGQP